MMKMRKTKLPVILLMAVIFAVSVMGTGVYAAMTAPAKPISTEDGIIKCAGNGATGVMVEMLGGDLVAASEIHLSTSQMPLFMPVFGTANNEVPDPWVYNAFYNAAAGTKVENASSVAYSGTAGPGTLNTTLVDNNIPLFINRPDFIIGTEAELATYLAAIDSNENYKPAYGIGAGMANPEQIMATVTSYAKGMQEVIDNSNGKIKGRYGSPAKIAEEFSEFYKGTMDYCNSRAAALKKESVKVINVSGVSNNEWTVQSGEAQDIFNEYIKKAGGTPVGQTDTIMTTGELQQADVLLVGNIALKTSIETAFDNAGYKAQDIPDIYVIPRGVYLWSVRSPEGALTVPWLTSLFYPELAKEPEINPVYTTAYFYSNFYHYTGNLEEIIGVVLTEVSLPEGLTVDLSNWDSSIIPGVEPVVKPADTPSENGSTTEAGETNIEEDSVTVAADLKPAAEMAAQEKAEKSASEEQAALADRDADETSDTVSSVPRTGYTDSVSLAALFMAAASYAGYRYAKRRRSRSAD